MDNHATRRARLRRLMRKQGADALLVTDFCNVTYLTGFTGDDSYLLLARDDQIQFRIQQVRYRRVQGVLTVNVADTCSSDRTFKRDT